jgi:tripartite-type tricarboxylate transporter receptor subunit TctC
MTTDHMFRGLPRGRRTFVKAASAAAAGLALPARAQSDWPRGPVKVIVGLPPGGAADIIARTIGQQMEKTIGQPVIIENRPGGQFVISVQALLNAPADGQTLLYLYNGYAAVNATLKLFDLEKQTLPVAQVASTPIVLLVRGDSPHKTARDLFAWARANPGRMNFGTVGAGGVEHLKWTQIENTMGYKGNAVTYKGGPDSMQALLGGEIDCLLTAGLFGKMYAPKGQARVLAVLEPTRWQDFPDVPTMAEAGVNVPPMTYWGGYVVKAGTPPAVLQRLFREITAAAVTPPVLERLAATGGMPVVSKSPDEFGRLLTSDVAWMTEAAKGLNLGS